MQNKQLRSERRKNELGDRTSAGIVLGHRGRLTSHTFYLLPITNTHTFLPPSHVMPLLLRENHCAPISGARSAGVHVPAPLSVPKAMPRVTQSDIKFLGGRSSFGRSLTGVASTIALEMPPPTSNRVVSSAQEDTQ